MPVGPEVTPPIFINYRNVDRFAAHALDVELSQRLGAEAVFMASRSIAPGAHYPEALLAAASGAQAMLSLIGDDWARSLRRGRHPWTLHEIQAAQSYDVPIIPVLLSHNMPMPTARELPRAIDPVFSRLLYERYDVRGHHSYVELIIQGLCSLLKNRNTAATAS